MRSFHRSKVIRTFKGCSNIDVAALVRCDLRVRAERPRGLHRGRCAIWRWQAHGLQLLGSLALLDPIDKTEEGSQRKWTWSREAVTDAGSFKMAKIILNVGSDGFNAFIVIDSAIWWDELVRKSNAREYEIAFSKVEEKTDPCHVMILPPAFW